MTGLAHVYLLPESAGTLFVGTRHAGAHNVTLRAPARASRTSGARM
jgi:hypothetical protein